LQQLVHAGLIRQHRLSRHLIYSAEYSTMNALFAYLTENCSGRDTAYAPVCKPVDGFATGERRSACTCTCLLRTWLSRPDFIRRCSRPSRPS
jgi:hypothetical protein